MTEIFLINEQVSGILKAFPSIFDDNMHDDIPTYDEAVKQVTCAFEEGIHYRGNDNQLLGDLSETWVRNQKYVNMSLDDAMYCAFMESATLLVLLVKPLENIQIKLS